MAQCGFDLGAVVDLADPSRNDGLAFGQTLRNIEVLEDTHADDHFAGGASSDLLTGGARHPAGDPSPAARPGIVLLMRAL